MSTSREPSARPVVLSYDQDKSRIAIITLNRPGCLNAINVLLLTDLISSLRQVKDAKVKACILTGAGASFCSGEDLKETLAPSSSGNNADELRHAFEQLQEITRLMTGSDTIFFAAIRGWAVGGGAEIALAADFVIAAPDSIFKFPEILHGHAPTGGITIRLPLLSGLQQAKRLLLFGDELTAEQAQSLNLVTELSDDPLQRCKELALKIGQRSSRTLAAIKKCIETGSFPLSESALRAEVDAASWCFSHESAMEAFSAFARRKNKKSPASADRLESQTLVSMLVNASSSYPQRTFLRFGVHDTSFAQFTHDVALLAGGLLAAGIVTGDVIGAIMVNSEDMVKCWFATMWIGAVWAPLHTEIRGLVLRGAIELIRPKILIADDVFPMRFMPTDLHLRLYMKGDPYPGINSFSSLVKLSLTPAPPSSVITSRSTCTLLFTSGTTGASKACELSHSYFISAGSSLVNSLRLHSEDILFCPFPLCHADATSLTIVPALILGATAAISQRFSASKWWDEIRQAKATVADFMGATLSILNKAKPTPTDTENTLRIMWGVPVPAWVEEFEARFDLKVVEVYGSTETGLPVVQPIDRPRVKGSCGIALDGVDLRIIDENGQDVLRDAVGDLLVRRNPDERFSGYYKNIYATEESLQNGWFHTGDLCRLDVDGNLFFIGRGKHVIRRRGENISSFEVEEGLLLHHDILECAAYGVPSELTEEDLMVSILKRPNSSLSEDEVHEFAVQTMTRFQVPRYIEFVDELPRSPTSKLLVYILQEAFARGERAASVKDFEMRR